MNSITKTAKSNLNGDLKSAFFDMSHSPFAIFDKDLNFVDVNQATTKNLNLNKEDLLGENLIDIFPHLKNTDRYFSYLKVIETGEPIGFDEVIIHTDTEVFKFITRAFKIGDGLGITTLDISNLMETVDQLRVTKENLKQANNDLKSKNQELEEFSYVAAHDLRAPITNMRSLLDMFEQENIMTDRGALVFEKLKNVTLGMCNKLKALNNVIALKASDPKRKVELSFSDVVSNIKINHSQEIISTRTIIKEDFSSCPTIFYDAAQLETILQNLISNAIKYKHPKRKPVIQLKTKVVNGQKILTVKDNGIGFDAETDKAKIFGLFKRMHTHVKGLGVGLYIIQSIINSNKEEIDVESEINKGTEFKIIFNSKA